MLICNTCERTEEEVKIAKNTLLCRSCSKKLWYENNREKIRENSKEYRENNKEKLLNIKKNIILKIRILFINLLNRSLKLLRESGICSLFLKSHRFLFLNPNYCF